MKRFWWGTATGALSGGLVYWFTGHVGAAVVCAVCVAVIVWFSNVGDVLVSAGDEIGEVLGKSLDDIL
jgi:dolichol kinase